MATISEYPFETDPSTNARSEMRGSAEIWKATFNPIVVEIEEKKTNYGLGFVFKRGPKDNRWNAIWNLEQRYLNGSWVDVDKWVKNKKSEDPDINPTHWEAGDILRVRLKRDDWVTKNGEAKRKYVITEAKRLPPDTPVDDPWLKAPGEEGGDSTPKAQPAPTPRGNSGDLDARILKNSAWNNLTAMLAAEQIETHKFYALWEEQLHHAMQGEPLFQDDDVEFQLYKNKFISPPEVPQEQAAMDLDTPPLDYQLESKALMKQYFGEDGASDAAVWLSENVGSVNDSENEKSYWFKVYAMLKKEFGG